MIYILAYLMIGLGPAYLMVTYRGDLMDETIDGVVDELATELDDRDRLVRRLRWLYLIYIVAIWPVFLLGVARGVARALGYRE